MDLFPLPPNFLGLSILSTIITLIRQLDSRSFRGIFLSYSRIQKSYEYFCPSISRYILSADVTFFETKPEISTSSPVASEDAYDYLFYQDTLINSGKSTSENVTGKDPLWFQDPLQTYTRQTAPPPVPSPASVSNPAQKSSEDVTAQLPDISTF